jgi:hypothetical protein
MVLRTVFLFALAGLGLLALALPALAQTPTPTPVSQLIAATVSVQNVALTVSPNSINYGTMQFGTSKSSTQLSPPVTFTVNNTGNVSVTLKAYGANGTVGGAEVWTITASAPTCPGTPLSSFAHTVTPSGSTTEQFLTASTSGSILSSSLAAGSTLSFTSKLYMPCPGSSGVGQTVGTSITVFATAN